MGGRFLLLGLIWLACALGAFAQPVDDPPPPVEDPPAIEGEDLPPGFSSLPVLEAPPREESGPLGKKITPRQAEEPVVPDGSLAPGTFDPEAAAVAVAPSDQSRIRGYVDGLMTGLIAAGEFPGATIVIIQDGKVTLQAGYGFADIRARTPVDPDRTRFRVASISKLFTATAVMQLVEQGKVDLNADVNTYLTGFKIPPTYAEPVTLANILTHTAGFDDKYLGMSAPLTGLVEPLGQYLARSMPPRVLPPGKTFAYSNHAYALAGHVVEGVSGQDFNTYVQEHIFTPLGMTSSTFGVPYPVPPEIAVPYFKGGDEGGFKRAELDRMRVGPAGDLITTADDIAKFMLVHMNQGVYGDDEHLLSQQSIERMHAQHFTQVEGLDGWAYGFMEGRRNGVRWIGHDGSWFGFCSQLAFVPETKTGFFVAYNGDCSFAASAPLRKGLFDVLWPSRGEPVAETNPTAEMRAQQLVGTYMSVRRARADFTVMAAAAGQFTVSAPGEGRLVIHLARAGRDLVLLPQANGTWINPDFQWRAAALVDGSGQPTQLVIDSNVFDKVTGASAWAMWSIALAIVVAFCVMALWGWTNGFLSRQIFGGSKPVIAPVPRATAFVAAGLTIGTLIAMAALMANPAPLDVLHGPTPTLMVLLAIPVALGVLVIPMIYWSFTGFGIDRRARFAQAGYALLTMAILILLAFCWQWGLHPFAL
jgi:CubicO group peptidase (beta-lactamase class C family)